MNARRRTGAKRGVVARQIDTSFAVLVVCREEEQEDKPSQKLRARPTLSWKSRAEQGRSERNTATARVSWRAIHAL